MSRVCAKRGLLVLLLALGLGAPAADAQDYSTGLVGHWTLDETVGTSVTDSSPNSNDGAMYGGLTGAATTVGIVGAALNFDGDDDYIDIPHSGALEPAEYTISAWVRIDGVPTNWGLIVDKGEAYEMGIGDSMQTTCGHNDGGGYDIAYSPSSQITAGVWYLVACAYDGSRTRNYVNGVEVASVASGAPGNPGYPVRISGFVDDADQYNFDGAIDDIRIYDRALSAADLAALYDATKPPCSNPDGWEGEMTYNTTAKVMQLCNGTEWTR